MKMLMVAGVDLAVDDLGVIGDNDSSNCWRRIAEQHTDAEFDTLVLFHVTLLGLFFRDPGFRVWDVWASISYNYSHDSIHCGDRYDAYFDDVFHGYIWLILLMYTRCCYTLPSIWTSFWCLWLLVITIMLYYSGYVACFWLHIMRVGSSYWVLCYSYQYRSFTLLFSWRTCIVTLTVSCFNSIDRILCYGLSIQPRFCWV